MTTAIAIKYRPAATARIEADKLDGQQVYHLFVNDRYQGTFLDRAEAIEAKTYHLEELNWMR